jgi:hypothetical protein
MGSLALDRLKDSSRAPMNASDLHSRPCSSRIPHPEGWGTFRFRPTQQTVRLTNTPPGRVGYFQIPTYTADRAAHEYPTRKGGVLSSPTCTATRAISERVGGFRESGACFRQDLKVPHPSGWGIQEV